MRQETHAIPTTCCRKYPPGHQQGRVQERTHRGQWWEDAESGREARHILHRRGSQLKHPFPGDPNEEAVGFGVQDRLKKVTQGSVRNRSELH